MIFSLLNADKAIAMRSKPIITRKAFRRPTEKACATPTWVDWRTASRLGSKPMDAMVAVTMAVAIAKLMIFAPLRTELRNEETIPYFSSSTELSTELLLGE